MAKFVDIKIKSNFANFKNRTQAIQRKLDDLPKEFLPVVRKNTPIDTGNARRNTIIKDSTTIRSDYPYAERLENNWSKQTRGQGFIKPSLRWLNQRIRQILRGR
jgi:hypothetical protein